MELHHLSTLISEACTFHGQEPWFFPTVLALLIFGATTLFRPKRINVPSVPPPTLLSRFTAPYKWLYNGVDLIDQGMALHGIHGRSFQIHGLVRSNLFITSPALIAEYARLPPTTMSFRDGVDEHARTDHAFYPGFMVEAAIVGLIRKYLHADGKSLARIFPDVAEELALGWRAYTPALLHDENASEWVDVDVIPTMRATVTRTVNRVFFGARLARDKDFEKAILTYISNVFTSALALDTFPVFMQAAVAPWIYRWKKPCLAVLTKFLAPVIEERRAKLAVMGGNWKLEERPRDSVQWVLEHEPDAPVEVLVYRLIFMVAASAHTTYNTMVHILYDLAEHPEIQGLLREEIAGVKDKENGALSYAALSSCTLLDSVMRESIRMNDGNVSALRRRCMIPHTFTDGTHIPAGTWVMIPDPAIHRSSSIYTNPSTFDAFRFQRLRQQVGKENALQFVQTSKDYLPFGHGPNSCPGRFLAGALLKALVAEVVGGFEWGWKEGEGMPGNWSAGISVFPRGGFVAFRRLGGKEV